MHLNPVTPAASLENGFFNHGCLFVDAQTSYYCGFVANCAPIYSIQTRFTGAAGGCLWIFNKIR